MSDAAHSVREEVRDENPAVSLALGAASPEKADALLDEQTRFIRLQARELEHELTLRHWSLRVHHISDVMKVIFEVSLAAIALAIVGGISVAVWSASHDHALVIEAFSVPPDMAARGLNGQAVAAQIEDRLAALQDATGSARPADSYANNWGDDIKVQIPDTGISVGEFYRLLVSWLGHQSRISGEVWRSGDSVSITVRAGDDGASTVAGKEANFSALLQQAAEAVYRRTQPYRYAAYLERGFFEENTDRARQDRAKAILENLSVDGATPRERAWAWVGRGVNALFFADMPSAAAAYRQAIALNPQFGLAFSDLDQTEAVQEHEEAALAAARASVRLLSGDADVDITPRARAITFLDERGNAKSDVGDYSEAVADYTDASHLPDYSGEAEQAREAGALDLALAHDARAARSAWKNLPVARNPATLDERLVSLLMLHDDLGEWSETLSARAAATAALQRTFVRHQAAQILSPYVVRAMAHSGDIPAAEALIAKVPLDCDLCLRVRGGIAALRHDWSGAAHWFALVSARTPDIPFADTEWGEMLLHKGDYDGAIAKFREANSKGSHFADPLEMWGEAFMQKNRSDLALAKFDEANRYAPNWGRLHLEWGKALFYSGRTEEAKKQFARSASLVLSVADRRALRSWTGTHG